MRLQRFCICLIVLKFLLLTDHAAAVDATFVLDEQQSSLTIDASTRVVFLLEDSDTQQLEGTLDTTLDFGTTGGFPLNAEMSVNGAELSALAPFSLTLGAPPLLGVQVVFDGAVADVTTPNPPATLTQLPTGLVRYQFDAAEFDITLVEGLIEVSGIVNQSVDLSTSPVTGTPEPGTFGTLTFLNLSEDGPFTLIDAQLDLPIMFTEVVVFDEQEVALDVSGHIVAYSSFAVALSGVGDFDGDSDVDGQDYLLIERNEPSLISSWVDEYPGIPELTAKPQAVPEPGAFVLVLGGIWLVYGGARPLKRARLGGVGSS